MIRCTPQGLCSWNFYLDGDGQRAGLEFNWIGESGSITADGRTFEVRKESIFSGTWTLEAAGKVAVSANKPNMFWRSFEIKDRDGIYLLEAKSPFSRSFRLERSGNPIAEISPEHAFTRRATIRVNDDQLDFATLAFAFWLVVLTWRRAANSNAGGASGGAG